MQLNLQQVARRAAKVALRICHLLFFMGVVSVSHFALRLRLRLLISFFINI